MFLGAGECSAPGCEAPVRRRQAYCGSHEHLRRDPDPRPHKPAWKGRSVPRCVVAGCQVGRANSRTVFCPAHHRERIERPAQRAKQAEARERARAAADRQRRERTEAAATRAAELRDAGFSTTAIADALNGEAYATPGAKGKWYPASVGRLLRERERVAA